VSTQTREAFAAKPIERCRVWMIALEDDETEMHRRIAAAMIQFGLDRSEVEPWLFVTTRSHAPDFLLAASTSDGVLVSADAVAAMKAEIIEKNIGVVIVDPYVYVHSINENDNMGQAAVMQALTGVVAATNVALSLVHHAKKPAANDRGGPSAADIRGASAPIVFALARTPIQFPGRLAAPAVGPTPCGQPFQ
jgi:RecA-family ATPase